MFGDIRTGILLLITHILACITVGICCRFFGIKKGKSNYKFNTNKYSISHPSAINFSNLGEILSSAIMNSIRTILLIGGFVVLSSVMISILNQTNIFSILRTFLHPIFNIFKIDFSLTDGFFAGIVELTNGIKAVSSVHIKSVSQSIVISSFLLGFGGICVMLQVFSIVSKAHLSIKPYIIGKVLHGIFAALYTYIFLNISLFFNLDII